MVADAVGAQIDLIHRHQMAWKMVVQTVEWPDLTLKGLRRCEQIGR
jgi:hypothetical protein